MSKPEQRRKKWPLYAEGARMDAIAVIDKSVMALVKISCGNPTELEALRMITKIINDLRVVQHDLVVAGNENPPCSGGHS